MSKWEKVRLGDIFKVTSGGTPSKSKPEYYKNGSIQWIRTGDLKSKYITKASNLITEEALRNSSAKLFPIDTVLIAMYGATIGACSILAIEATTNQACAAFLPNKKVDSSYLYYFLCSKKNELIKLSVGGAQPNISGTILKGISIPVPPLEVQKKITQALDTAAELIALRKKQRAELDNLIKSTFYEMFGDPVTNEKGWDYCLVEETIKVLEAGWSVEGVQRERNKDEIAVLKVSAVTSGYFRETECKVIDKNLKLKKYVFPHKGDLLFSRANTKELVGATCMVLEDYPELILPDKLWRIEFNSLSNFVYMKYILSDHTIRNSLSNTSTGTSGSMYNISMDKLKSTRIPLPPLTLQNQFAEIVTKIEEQKALVQKAIDESQYLFDSLMSEYFE